MGRGEKREAKEGGTGACSSGLMGFG